MLTALQQRANRPLTLSATKTPGTESSSSEYDEDQAIDFGDRIDQ